MKKELIHRLHGESEQAAHSQEGGEYWFARELQHLLGYVRWENFEQVVQRAITACETAGYPVSDHFRDVTKMVGVGSKASRPINDLILTRYACYLIAQNGDPRKQAIAFAQTYFAVQTRKRELIEQRLAETERVQAGEKLTVSQKALSGVMFARGVDSQGFSRILGKGDAALFGGMSTQDMKKRLGVPVSRPLADFMPTLAIKARISSTKSPTPRSRSKTCMAKPTYHANMSARF